MADYVAEAMRLRLAKDRALAQVTRLFGGPPAEDVLALVQQRAGRPPHRFVIGRVLDITTVVGFSIRQSVYAESLVMTAIEENIMLTVPSAVLARSSALILRGHELGQP